MDRNLNKNWSFLICLTLILAALAVFYQVHRFEFVTFDDPDYVYNNQNIQSEITLQSVKWALTTGSAGNWHPLTWLSHMLDWQLYGNNAGGHHITNLVFHIVNILLLFFVLKKMTDAQWPSAFVAALFALHPLHVESVAWVSERKDVLSTFFWLLTMWAYVRFVGRPKLANYLLIVLFFALGLMSKPMLVTLPFVLLLLDYWPLNRVPFGQAIDKTNRQKNKKNIDNRFQRRTLLYLIREKIPLFTLSAASSAITFFVQRNSEAVVTLTMFPVKYRFFNAFISYAEYIEKMFWPARLAFFYPHLGQNISPAYAVISAAFLLVVTIVILLFAQNHRYLFTGWFWYIGTLVPVIGMVQVGSQALADRYTYITLTGLFIIIAWGLPELLVILPHRKFVLWISSLIVLSVLAVTAFIQTQYWKDSIVLCQHAIEVTKNNCVANVGIAIKLLKQGRTEESIRYYSEAVRIQPDNVTALNGLGTALCYAKRVDEAVVYYERAIEIQPENAFALNNLGIALCWQGKFDEAIAYFNQALRIDPQSEETKNNLIQAQRKIQESKDTQNQKK